MKPPYDNKDLPLIIVATAALATALGISYAYVDISLNRMGETALRIGLNASMPALGWLLLTPLLPTALKRFSPQTLFTGLLAVAMLAILGLPSIPNPWAWLPLRFLFGSSIGLAFRLIEYILNAYSPSSVRTRNIGLYSALFCAGGGLGAGIAPFLGLEGWPAIIVIFALVGFSGIVLRQLPSPPLRQGNQPSRDWSTVRGIGFVAIIGAFVFGLFEAVPYTLMPVYAIRSGVEESWAVWTASAFLMGEVVFPVPTGLLADRMSKIKLLWLSAICTLLIPAFLPMALHSPFALLILMFFWGGAGGNLYLLCLSMLADICQGRQLLVANTWFGTLYAAGGLIGPIYHGIAMDQFPRNGLLCSAASLFAVFLIALTWGGKRRHVVA